MKIRHLVDLLCYLSNTLCFYKTNLLHFKFEKLYQPGIRSSLLYVGNLQTQAHKFHKLNFLWHQVTKFVERI